MKNIYEIYPLTIVRDRYNGIYSGGMYLAFNLDYYEIPIEISGSDIPCWEWWNNNKDYLVGKGETPTKAINDLLKKLGGNMIFKTNITINEYDTEQVDVDLDVDDIANIIARYYKIDFKTAKSIAFDLELDESQAVREFFEYDLEDYARDKFFRKQSEC